MGTSCNVIAKQHVEEIHGEKFYTNKMLNGCIERATEEKKQRTNGDSGTGCTYCMGRNCEKGAV